MQKTGIEWTDFSWNPMTGCLHECEYCYARKMARYRKTAVAKRFEPEFHPEKIDDINDVLRGIVFCGSNCDLFGAWVNPAWMHVVVDKARSYWSIVGHKASIMFLTKNPARYAEAVQVLKQNKNDMSIWLGATLDAGYRSNAPDVMDRINTIDALDYPRKWLSIEPLDMQFGGRQCMEYQKSLATTDVQWVVIGTKTPCKERFDAAQQSRAWSLVQMFVNRGIPVFVKDSIISRTDMTMNLDNFTMPDGGKAWPRNFPAGVALATKTAAWSPRAKKQAKPRARKTLFEE